MYLYSKKYAVKETPHETQRIHKSIHLFLLVDSKGVILTQIIYHIEKNVYNYECQIVPGTLNTWFLHSQLIFKWPIM